MSEIRIHRSLHHANVLAFEHFFEDKRNVYMLLELCQNQTMNELLKRRKRLTEVEVQCYLMQIIMGTKYLHAHRVIHRDLKLGNLFLTDKMELKLADFGLATKLEFDGDRKRTVCGTPNYIAPEILSGKQGHSYEVDIWSIGVILYTLLIGKPPFETSDVKTTYRRIKANAYTFPEHIRISASSRDLITKILCLDPSRRLTLDQILEHPFLCSQTIPKLMPASTLACPPSASFVKQNSAGVYVPVEEKKRLESTAPVKSVPLAALESKEVLKLKTAPRNDSEVWVAKWVDYSGKYGLGYLMSNGCFGVFFNDTTQIVLHTNERYALRSRSNFDYIERRKSDNRDVITSHTVAEYPKELQKKVTLLQHFRSYLDCGSKEKPKTSNKAQVVYIKKWMRTKHAIMFRLSNKLIQVIFEDKTEVILCSESKEMTYLNKRGEREVYPLATALDSENREMTKRLKYTKDILTHMLASTGSRSHKDDKGRLNKEKLVATARGGLKENI